MLRNRIVLAVSFAICMAYTGIGMVGPVRVLYAQTQGASLEIIGAMASAYLISNFAAQYPAGWLSDHSGRRLLMILGLIAQAVLSLVYLVVNDPLLFVVLRFAEGIAAAAVLPSARALIADAIPAEKQGQAFGIFSGFFNAGFLLGPAIGGVLAATGYATAFFGAALFRVLALVVVVVFIPHLAQSGATTTSRPIFRRGDGIFRLPLLGAYIIAFGDYLWLGFDLAILPLWLHDHVGATVITIGLAYTAWAIPSVVLTPFGGLVADRARRSHLILVFGLAQVPLYVTYGLVTNTWLVIVLFAVHGIVYSFIQPAVDAHVATSSTHQNRARVQSMYAAIGLLGAFAGANALTKLYVIDFRLPLFAIGVVYGLCVLVGGLVIRWFEGRGRTMTSVTVSPLV